MTTADDAAAPLPEGRTKVKQTALPERHSIPAPLAAKKQKRRRPGKVFPPPERSARLYCEIDSSMVHMFRFLLEAEDNLGLMTVVDRWRAVLQVRFSPHQEKEIRAFLAGMQGTVPFTMLDVPPV